RDDAEGNAPGVSSWAGGSQAREQSRVLGEGRATLQPPSVSRAELRASVAYAPIVPSRLPRASPRSAARRAGRTRDGHVGNMGVAQRIIVVVVAAFVSVVSARIRPLHLHQLVRRVLVYLDPPHEAD